jgi:hypothetical protein
MRIRSGGELVLVRSELPWVTRLVARAVGLADPGPADPGLADPGLADPGSTGAAEADRLDSADADLAAAPSLNLIIEASREPFDRSGLRVVTRGAYSDGRRTLLQDAGGAGFDLLVVAGTELSVRARYRPSRPVRAANLLLRNRFGLLAGQILVHYPVLWRAGWRGRVPLHASVVTTGTSTVLLAGPGGVGKSTVLSAALAAGASATADNLCCADERRCYGIAEPLRTDAAGERGPRTSHGRVDRPFHARAEVLDPDLLVVLQRAAVTEVAEIAPDEAARALIAGTYSAGELRRYWAFAATLALATGSGPAHPPIDAVALQYARRLPCVRVRVGDHAKLELAAVAAGWERQSLGGRGSHG